jgi:CDP-diacylglycerol--inositol 3-phosphatidyltransferase
VRIALAVVAFMYAMTNHKLFFVCYLLSELLDALDGHAARYYKQCTPPSRPKSLSI